MVSFICSFLPGSFGIWEPHDNAVNKFSELTEISLQAIFGGVVIQTAEEKFPGLLGLIHGGLKTTILRLVTRVEGS